MNRRAFLLGLGSVLGIPQIIGGDPVSPRHAPLRRGLVCTPFSGYGVQRCEAGIESDILDVTASDTQHADEWCWAACIEAVFTYYGHPVAQERIVEDAFGVITNMPGSPYTILSSLNRTWRDDDGDNFTVYATTVGSSAVTAAQDLATDHPLIIGTLGHAMVLTSLTYDRNGYGQGQVVYAEVRDPWPYNPRHRVLSYQEWASIMFAARIRVSD